MMGSVLVTGATGIVGANLLSLLSQKDYAVTGTYCSTQPSVAPECCEAFDFLSYDDCLKATRKKKTVVISVTRNQRRGSSGDMRSCLRDNYMMSAGLLDACSENHVEHVILLSTSTVYQPKASPIAEHELDLNQRPYESYWWVGELNRHLEELAHTHYRQGAFKLTIVRPQCVFGPYDNFNFKGAGVIPMLIMRALSKEDPFIVWGDGTPVRDFIYAPDLATDLEKFIRKPGDGDIYNISHGWGMSVGEVVEVILECCEHCVPVVYDSSKPSAVPYRVLDDGVYRSRFGEPQRTPFKEAILQTIKTIK